MSLTVKAYVLPCRTKKDDFEEIRRFTITKTDANDFKKLLEKVGEVFPALDKDKTSLHWKDNDGDLIHFTTNCELAEAIKSVTDGVFKLYAQEKPLFKDSTELHLGILCSTCKKPVQGSLYKCLVCHDYDLCHSCELVGTHLEHAMIKIPTPNTPWVAQIMQYSYTYGPISPVSPMLLKCRTEEGGARSALPLKLDEQLSPIMDRPSFASSIGQPYSRNEWSLFNDTPMSSRSGIDQANAMEHSYHPEEMQSRQSRIADLDTLDIFAKSSHRESLFNYNESPPEKTSGDWTILNSSSKSKDTNEVTSTCSTRIESSSVKTQAESTRVTEISSEKEASSIKMASASEMTSASSKLYKGEQETSLKSPDAGTADYTATASDETKKEATDGTVKSTDTETVTTMTPSINGDAVPDPDTISSTTKDSKEEKEETTTEESSEPKPKVDNNLYYPQRSCVTITAFCSPSLSDGFPITYGGYDGVYFIKLRRYAEALDNLMSMGFTNEGGWLTVLVEEKRGDIIRVLDFIENNIQKCRENEQTKSRN